MTEYHRKKRGISLVRYNDRPNSQYNPSVLYTPVATQKIEYHDSRLQSSQSVQYSVRSNSAPKTNVTFTYQGVSPQMWSESVQAVHTPRSDFKNNNVSGVRSHISLSQSEARGSHLAREKEVGVFDNYADCKDEIAKKLFREIY